jgi:hypothetical protein
MMNVNMYGQIPTNQNPNMGNYQKGYYWMCIYLL